MVDLARMLTARRGNWTDWACYAYLALGVAPMFGPVLWLGISSLKSPAGLTEYPPTLLPYEQARAAGA